MLHVFRYHTRGIIHVFRYHTCVACVQVSYVLLVFRYHTCVQVSYMCCMCSGIIHVLHVFRYHTRVACV